MVLVIAPLVKVANRIETAIIVAAHAAGLLVGSAVVFALASAAGLLLGPAGVVGRTTVAVGLAALAILGLLNRVPQSSWQVPTGWMRRRRRLGSLAYGCALGTGLLTKAPYGAWLGGLLVVVGLGSPLAGAAAGIAYGFGRFIPVLVGVVTAGSRDPTRTVDGFMGIAPFLKRLDVALLLLAAAWFAFG